MRLTKFQVMRCIMDVNERIGVFDDEMKEIALNVQMIDERIKAFNKKVANGKADTQIILGQHQDNVETQVTKALSNIQELEEKLKQQVEKENKQKEAQQNNTATRESGLFS